MPLWGQASGSSGGGGGALNSPYTTCRSRLGCSPVYGVAGDPRGRTLEARLGGCGEEGYVGGGYCPGGSAMPMFREVVSTICRAPLGVRLNPFTEECHYNGV